MSRKSKNRGAGQSSTGGQVQRRTQGEPPNPPKLSPEALIFPEDNAATRSMHIAHHERLQMNITSGPIPPPEILRQYDQIVPGSATRIIEQAEKQSSHRQSLEKYVIEQDNARSFWGLGAGMFTVLICVGVGGWLVYMQHDWAGTTIATGPVVALVTAFIYGTRSRRQERLKKSEIMAGKKPEEQSD